MLHSVLVFSPLDNAHIPTELKVQVNMLLHALTSRRAMGDGYEVANEKWGEKYLSHQLSTALRLTPTIKGILER